MRGLEDGGRLVAEYGPAPLQDACFVIAEHRASSQAARQGHDPRGVGSFGYQVANEHETVRGGETASLEEILKFAEATVDVTHHDGSRRCHRRSLTALPPFRMPRVAERSSLRGVRFAANLPPALHRRS